MDVKRLTPGPANAPGIYEVTGPADWQKTQVVVTMDGEEDVMVVTAPWLGCNVFRLRHVGRTVETFGPVTRGGLEAAMEVMRFRDVPARDVLAGVG